MAKSRSDRSDVSESARKAVEDPPENGETASAERVPERALPNGSGAFGGLAFAAFAAFAGFLLGRSVGRTSQPPRTRIGFGFEAVGTAIGPDGRNAENAPKPEARTDDAARAGETVGGAPEPRKYRKLLPKFETIERLPKNPRTDGSDESGNVLAPNGSTAPRTGATEKTALPVRTLDEGLPLAEIAHERKLRMETYRTFVRFLLSKGFSPPAPSDVVSDSSLS